MLPEALRLLRVFHDMKQNELAEKLDVSKSYISELEKGNRTPSFDVLEKYALLFQVPISSIMFFSEHIEGVQQQTKQVPKAKGIIASKIINFLQLIESRTEIDGV